MEKTVERLTLDADKKSAEKLRKRFLKVLAKDTKSEELHLEFRYNLFRSCAEYLVIGHPKTVKKCLAVMKKFVKALDKKQKQKEEKARKEAQKAERDKHRPENRTATDRFEQRRSAPQQQPKPQQPKPQNQPKAEGGEAAKKNNNHRRRRRHKPNSGAPKAPQA